MECQGANELRVGALRRAATAVLSLPFDLDSLPEASAYEELIHVRGIGPGMARAILEIRRTGGWSLLSRLNGEHDGPRVLAHIPGIGPDLAARIHELCGVDTLEDLELAVTDGRLATVPGIGRGRVRSLRIYLAGTLGSPDRQPIHLSEPEIEVLLDVDSEYRTRATRGELPLIAPRHFNPAGERWLPVWHTTAGSWNLSALFCNTERAHRLGHTRDWVTVYFAGEDQVQGQRTIVTETAGTLSGRRVVRGREIDCSGFYGVPFAGAG